MKKSKLYGKLSKADMEELDRLILKMKEANKKNSGKRKLRMDEIVVLPGPENEKLWEYILHICRLEANWPNINCAINTIAAKSGRDPKSVQDECISSMGVHCIRYVWRHYSHSDDCGYVLKTAHYGWLSWIEEQNMFHLGPDEMRELAFENMASRGHRVFNVSH